MWTNTIVSVIVGSRIAECFDGRNRSKESFRNVKSISDRKKCETLVGPECIVRILREVRYGRFEQ